MSDIRLQNGALSTTQVGAYNVYTGARYVPLIAGEWDSTKSYEPLTIVINQGNSYTSAQYVPAGVPLQNNGPYWFLTGNFNGQISSLQNQIDVNNQKIDKINLDLNTNTNDEIWLMIGDSYGDINGGRYNSAWPESFATQRGLSNGQYYNLCKGGAGFKAAGEGQNNLSVFNEWYNNHTTINITHIIIAQGANERNATYDELIPYATTLINRIRSLYPHVKIYLSCITACLTYYAADNAFRTDKVYSQIAGALNLSYIKKGYSMWISNNNISSDLIHPTLQGTQLLGKALACAVVNGLTIIPQKLELLSTVVLNENISGNLSINYSRTSDHEVYYITGNLTGLTVGSQINIGHSTYPPFSEISFITGTNGCVFSYNVGGDIILYNAPATTLSSIVAVGII